MSQDESDPKYGAIGPTTPRATAEFKRAVAKMAIELKTAGHRDYRKQVIAKFGVSTYAVLAWTRQAEKGGLDSLRDSRKGRSAGERDLNGHARRVDMRVKESTDWRWFCAATAKRIRAARLKKGISLGELAAALSCSYGAVVRWEVGRHKPPDLSTLWALAIALSCSLHDLLPAECANVYTGLTHAKTNRETLDG